jgi:hypothetical protein
MSSPLPPPIVQSILDKINQHLPIRGRFCGYAVSEDILDATPCVLASCKYVHTKNTYRFEFAVIAPDPIEATKPSKDKEQRKNNSHVRIRSEPFPLIVFNGPTFVNTYGFWYDTENDGRWTCDNVYVFDFYRAFEVLTTPDGSEWTRMSQIFPSEVRSLDETAVNNFLSDKSLPIPDPSLKQFIPRNFSYDGFVSQATNRRYISGRSTHRKPTDPNLKGKKTKPGKKRGPKPKRKMSPSTISPTTSPTATSDKPPTRKSKRCKPETYKDEPTLTEETKDHEEDVEEYSESDSNSDSFEWNGTIITVAKPLYNYCSTNPTSMSTSGSQSFDLSDNAPDNNNDSSDNSYNSDNSRVGSPLVTTEEVTFSNMVKSWSSLPSNVNFNFPPFSSEIQFGTSEMCPSFSEFHPDLLDLNSSSTSSLSEIQPDPIDLNSSLDVNSSSSSSSKIQSEVQSDPLDAHSLSKIQPDVQSEVQSEVQPDPLDSNSSDSNMGDLSTFSPEFPSENHFSSDSDAEMQYYIRKSLLLIEQSQHLKHQSNKFSLV